TLNDSNVEEARILAGTQERRLMALLKEEEQQLEKLNQDDVSRLLDILGNKKKPATPLYIARLRLKPKRFITEQMLTQNLEKCCVDLENFTRGQSYLVWPCLSTQTGKKQPTHIFHRECMLKWLRHDNKCPLCRYEVEGVDSSIIPVSMRLSLRRLLSAWMTRSENDNHEE
ncbi:unnamed protein product, partial [Didymodactylos carnosus]